MPAIPIVLAIIGAVLLGGLAYQALAARRDARRFPPPGRLVDVGGRRLQLHISGEPTGAPTVILESGMVSFSSNWAWVQPEVAKATRVAAVDRAGLGWSDPGPGPRDVGQNARELHIALERAGLSGSYVLAGHSYGGLVARGFAALYPEEVAGIVLVDASHPDQWARFGVSSKVVGYSNKVSSIAARFGLFRLLTGEYRLLARGLPQRAYDELLALASSPRALSVAGDAALAWDERSRPLVNAAGSLGDLPLVVLSVTEQPRLAEKLTELQATLPSLSSRSRHITVQGAYHEGLLAQREHARVVSEAILGLVAGARNDPGRGGRMAGTRDPAIESASGGVAQR